MVDWLIARWEQAFDVKEDLGYVSRETLVNIDSRVRRNLWRDRHGREYPQKLALAVLLMLLPCFASAGDSPRFSSFKKWTLHYQHTMGLDSEELAFVHYHHPKWCAWVNKPTLVGFDAPTTVGFSEPDWACLTYTPRELALHEMCHLRLHHLDLPDMSDVEKHEEVRKCMKDYWRDRE